MVMPRSTVRIHRERLNSLWRSKGRRGRRGRFLPSLAGAQRQHSPYTKTDQIPGTRWAFNHIYPLEWLRGHDGLLFVSDFVQVQGEAVRIIIPAGGPAEAADHMRKVLVMQ